MEKVKIIVSILIGVIVAVFLGKGLFSLLPYDASLTTPSDNTAQVEPATSLPNMEEIDTDNIKVPKYYKLTDETITNYTNRKLVSFGRSNPMLFFVKKEEPAQEQQQDNQNNSSGNEIINTTDKNLSLRGYVLPVDRNMFLISSPYGQRLDPFTKEPEMHRGIDIYNPAIKGKPVYAFLKGRVEFAGENGDYGNYVVINHGNCKTAYAHLMSIDPNVKVGAFVNTGQVIGLVGDTGRVTGPHLHFELSIGNIKVDPLPYLIIKLLEDENNQVLEPKVEVMQQQ